MPIAHASAHSPYLQHGSFPKFNVKERSKSLVTTPSGSGDVGPPSWSSTSQASGSMAFWQILKVRQLRGAAGMNRKNWPYFGLPLPRKRCNWFTHATIPKNPKNNCYVKMPCPDSSVAALVAGVLVCCRKRMKTICSWLRRAFCDWFSIWL